MAGGGQTPIHLRVENLHLDELHAETVHVKNLIREQNAAQTNIEGCEIHNFTLEGEDDAKCEADLIAERRAKETDIDRSNIQTVINQGWIKLSSTIIMFPRALHPYSDVYPGRQIHDSGELAEVVVKILKETKNCAREVDILLKLSDHPNIVKIIQSGLAMGAVPQIYIVMERCLQNLNEYIKEKPFHLSKAISFFRQTVLAIVFIHDNNIVHRDLRPSNILITLDGNNVKVTDFGISRELEYHRTQVTVTHPGAGTEGFKAPETYTGKPEYGYKSDIFSLGICGCIIVTHGKHPFGSQSYERTFNIVSGSNPDLSNIPVFPEPITNMRTQLIDLFMRMLNLNPKDRPTAPEILDSDFFEENLHQECETGGDETSSEADRIVEDCREEEMIIEDQISPTSVQSMANEELFNSKEWTKISSTIFMFNEALHPHTQVYPGKQMLAFGELREVVVKLLKETKHCIREVEILLKLADHPNIVKVLESGKCSGMVRQIYMVMERCRQNLNEYIKDNPFHLPKATSFFQQTVSAIVFIHDNIIAHRDLKPSNILITSDGKNVKVSDFGIGSELDVGRTQVTVTHPGAGTEGFKAPETYTGKPEVGYKVDIYSLGICGCIIMTHGEHPFGSNPYMWTANIIMNYNRDLSHIPEFPQANAHKRSQLINLLEDMLEPNPKDRPTALEVRNHTFFKGDLREVSMSDSDWK